MKNRSRPIQTESYRSYLIRCWSSPATEAGQTASRRFVVETVSAASRRWEFDTFAGLAAFLRAKLLNERQKTE